MAKALTVTLGLGLEASGGVWGFSVSGAHMCGFVTFPADGCGHESGGEVKRARARSVRRRRLLTHDSVLFAWTLKPSSMEPRSGSVRYEVAETIASGGMAVVYRAVHSEVVALRPCIATGPHGLDAHFVANRALTRVAQAWCVAQLWRRGQRALVRHDLLPRFVAGQRLGTMDLALSDVSHATPLAVQWHGRGQPAERASP